MSGRSDQQPEVARVRTRIHTAVPTPPTPTPTDARTEMPVMAPRTDTSPVDTAKPVVGAEAPDDRSSTAQPTVGTAGAAPAVPFGLTPTRMLLLLASCLFAAVVLSPLVGRGNDGAADGQELVVAPAGAAAATAVSTTSASGTDTLAAADVDEAQRAWDAGVSGSHDEIRRNIGAVMQTAAEVYAVPAASRSVECEGLAEQMAELNAGLAGTVSIDAAWGLALNEASDWLGRAVAACGTTRDQSAGSYVHSAQRALGRADARVAELDRLRQGSSKG